ncbi:MAG: molybdenum cofactor biosynthesis protein MoaE [Thermoplasmata archaeon]
MIEITEEDFDADKIIQGLRKEGVGAIVTFIGTVRDFTEMGGDERTEPVEVKQLIYECYKDMALEKMTLIRDHALVNYDIRDMTIIHRTGALKPHEQIVMIAVGAAHRKDAFKACEYAIEELKKSVPIWKKEVTSEKDYWIGEEGDIRDLSPKNALEE